LRGGNNTGNHPVKITPKKSHEENDGIELEKVTWGESPLAN